MRHIFILLLPLLFASCSEDFFSQTVKVDPPPYDKALVVHEFIGNYDSLLIIEVTRNYGILETVSDTSWGVRNATVQWLVDGQLALTPVTRGGDESFVYVADVPPGHFQPGKRYEIRVQHPDFPTISAEQVMPNPPVVDSVRYRENGGLNQFGERLSSVEAYLQDPGGERNYYELQVRAEYYQLFEVYDNQGNIIRIDTILSWTSVQYPDEPEDPNVAYGINGAVLVSDQFFDGQKYKFSFRTYQYDSDLRRYQVSVRAVTEEYYLYSRSEYRRRDSEENPLAEPVTVFYNMNGGLGIFGLYNERLFRTQ